MRILVLIAIGLLLYIVINNMFRKRNKQPRLDADSMVQCHHCGLHILEDEAIKSADQFYCSDEHKQEAES